MQSEFAQHHALTTDIFLVAHHWNWLESALAFNFVSLLVGDEAKALSIYEAVRDQDLRHAVFMAAAKDTLPEELCGEYDKVYNKRVRKKRKERVRLVHGLWTADHNKPESLFLLKDKAEITTKSHAFLRRLVESNIERKGEPEHMEFRPNIYEEFEHNDFVKLIREIDALTHEVAEFANGILKHSLPLVYPKVRRQRLGSMLAEIARQEHPDNQSNQKSP